MSDQYVLAADLGGTNLRTAAIAPDGEVLLKRQIKTPDQGSAEEIAAAIAAEANACIEEIGSDPKAFGAAAAALVDKEGRSVLSSPNLSQLDGYPLGTEVADRLGIKVILENDATAAAIGEWWLGASRDVDSSICVTLGTGVGGGLVLDGKPYRGTTGTAGEIGHINVEPDGAPCGCGSFGCLEQYASATAIVRIATELLSEHPDSRLVSIEDLTAKTIYDAGIDGDAAALETFRRMGRYLGIALTDLINVLNPDVIAIGGGAADGWDLFIEHVVHEVNSRAFRHPREDAQIVRASLGNMAGLLGAARVALTSSNY